MIILELGAAPAKPLSLNEERCLFWARRNARLHPWRDLTKAMAGNARLAARVAQAPCTVTVHIPVVGNYRRDPANFYPVVKACVDGLVLAKIWPDDTPDWVTVAEPVLHHGPTASIVLEPRTEQP